MWPISNDQLLLRNGKNTNLNRVALDRKSRIMRFSECTFSTQEKIIKSHLICKFSGKNKKNSVGNYGLADFI